MLVVKTPAKKGICHIVVKINHPNFSPITEKCQKNICLLNNLVFWKYWIWNENIQLSYLACRNKYLKENYNSVINNILDDICVRHPQNPNI